MVDMKRENEEEEKNHVMPVSFFYDRYIQKCLKDKGIYTNIKQGIKDFPSSRLGKKYD